MSAVLPSATDISGLSGGCARNIDGDVAELAVEEAVIGTAAELAVGCNLQTDALLKRESLGDRPIFRRGQFIPASFTAREPPAQIEESGRAQ